VSEPKRYSNLDIWKALHFGEGDEGWVKWEDYARLKAEVERLTDFTTRTIIPNEELQAQVDRLTKLLGMCESIDNSIDRWIESKRNAAKEGKQP